MSHLSTLPPRELPFLRKMLALDSKNYHVWTYSQWLCQHFYDTLALSSAELQFTDDLVREDVRNNSAWNHRYYLCFGLDELKYGKKEVVVDEEVVEREVEYAKGKIELAPQNPSPWLYLKGVCRKGIGRDFGTDKELRRFVEQFAGEDGCGGKGTRSSHAVDWLSEWHAESAEGERERARKMLERLGGKWDPIRKNYWDWRIRVMDMKMEVENRVEEVEG